MKGFETFFEIIKSQLKTNLDLIVSVIHWSLIQDLDFKCLCIGDEFKAELENNKGSELLPNGWNTSPEAYKFIYRSTKFEPSFWLLNCSILDEKLIVTLLPLNSSNSQEAYTVSIAVADFIPIVDPPDSNQLYERFKAEKLDLFSRFLNDKMIKKLSDDQKSIQNEKNDHSRIATTEESDSNVQFRRIPEARPSPLVDPQSLINPRIGGADLDPLGQGIGGGMIFDPFAGNALRPRIGPRPNLPPGMLPPGARYDPVGPIPDDIFFRPDPDHLPPPGPRSRDFI
ncbi:Proteasome inhibitor PI31 subunit [Sarcoptes scabiei]|uniref:Proteasome inhibitor PI31 subunit n=1 Tax=Sarcoptes scabiei TaxID=52283 RepID=A0A834VG31_SARSC|nr:Proteasome inhibitor PI31 subunit [Sarcoptes scabiei]